MFKRIKKNISSDNGASATVELIILLLGLFIILISVLDYGMYFNNRNVITNIAQNGARLAAVYGGAGDTPVARSYAADRTITPKCASVGANNQVSCAVYKELDETSGLTNTTITKIECGPNLTRLIGERTYCEIGWKYTSLGGSLSFANLFDEGKIRMTAESEVVAR